MTKVLFILGMAACTQLSALLPPVWQNVAELKAILQDQQLNQFLDSAELIQKIEKTETGWAIVTNRSTTYADITPEKQAMPGPEKFSIHFRK